jgi:23S rRNA (guanine745-N1)-methyltransferase
MLQCPVCENTLNESEDRFFCQQSHTFDRAREGYVNLLIPHKGMSRVTGDTKPMLVARREFLQHGYFNFLFTQLVHAARKILSQASDPASVLDIACGEGALIGYLRTELTQLSTEHAAALRFYAIDVSKDALKMAARMHKGCQFALANVHQRIPLVDRSIALITAVCAPRNFAEFSRVLTNNGKVMIAIPTPRHLNQLRSFTKLLEIEEEKELKIIESAKGFQLIDKVEIEDNRELSNELLQNVITMTPNFWHREQRVHLPEALSLTFSFKILTFEIFARS